MFTLEQLKEAHAKVRSGADFPRYIQEIKEIGLIFYEFTVNDGSVIYYGANGYQVKASSMYEPLNFHCEDSPAQLLHVIAVHQQGHTDFLTFCRQAAKAGVAKWVIDTRLMVCIYLNQNGDSLVREPIPQGDYA